MFVLSSIHYSLFSLNQLHCNFRSPPRIFILLNFNSRYKNVSMWVNSFAPCKGFWIAEFGIFALIKALWYPESGNFFLWKYSESWASQLTESGPDLWLESLIKVPLIKNPASNTWNLEPAAWNPESSTFLDSLTYSKFLHPFRKYGVTEFDDFLNWNEAIIISYGEKELLEIPTGRLTS